MAFLAPLAEGLVAGEGAAAAGGAAAAEGGAAAGGRGLLSKLGNIGGMMPNMGGGSKGSDNSGAESRVGSFSIGQQDAAMSNEAQREVRG